MDASNPIAGHVMCVSSPRRAHTISRTTHPSYPQAPEGGRGLRKGGSHLHRDSGPQSRERSVASPPFVWRSVQDNRRPLRGEHPTPLVGCRVGVSGNDDLPVGRLATFLRSPSASAGGFCASATLAYPVLTTRVTRGAA